MKINKRNKIMDNDLINYIRSNIDLNEAKTTYIKMCIERRALYNMNYSLYNQINDLIDNDNEIDIEEILVLILE